MAEGTNKRTLDKASLSPDANQTKKHQSGGSPENRADPSIQSHSGDVSCSDKLSVINKLAVDVCGHCNKTCDADGARGEAVQCDLCEGWVHASCENISSKLYKSFSSLAKSIPNMVYYCKHNKCQSRIKCIVAEYTKFSLSMSPKDTNRSVEMLSDKYASLSQSVNELSSKIDHLFTRNVNLQMEVDSALESNSPTTINPTSVAFNVVDELAKRDRRKCNIVVHNLPESAPPGPDNKADIDSFCDLCKSTFDMDPAILKSTRLGQKVGDKPRSLLIKLKDEMIQNQILSLAPKLRFSSTWKRIYIQPDMTPSEREAHKLLYNQLQTRRSQGESNLIIRNGKIVTYIPGQYKSRVLVNNQTATSAHPTTAPGNESDTHS